MRTDKDMTTIDKDEKTTDMDKSQEARKTGQIER